MKRNVLLMALLVFLSCLSVSYADDYRSGWVLARDFSATNDTALTASTKKWSLRPDGCEPLDRKGKAVQVGFLLPAENDTVTYSIYVYKTRSDAQLVCTGVATAGTMVASLGGVYAESATCTATWPTGVTVVNTTNGFCTVSFDACGAEQLYVELTDKNDKSIAAIYTMFGE
jgi:hypothetical protein